MFALKYLTSALTCPELFGGESMSKTTQDRIAIADKAMTAIFIVMPILGYAGIWYFRFYFNTDDTKVDHEGWWGVAYLCFATITGLAQLLTALILVYAMLSIRKTLKENNRQKTFNLNMFYINAVAFLLQIASFFIWYYEWYIYESNFYRNNCTLDTVADPDACNLERKEARQ